MSRRQFVFVLAAAPAARLPALAQGKAEPRTIVEQRVYDRAGVIPPDFVLRRSGIQWFTRRDEPGRVTFLTRFASPVARARAWDRCNTDSEWCALRESGAVLLKEISFPALTPDR
ncbi:MAG TPA: hypothetical protein VGR73_04310 [Bryobacteraceae bacterium]|nr:hypothetical protein [Bryobacteraceae bacterium]